MDINEIRVNVPLPISVPPSTIVPNIIHELQEQNHDEQYLDEEVPHEEPNLTLADRNEPHGIALNKPVRVRRPAISNDYVVYLQESEFDCGIDEDPVSFSQAMNSDESDKWLDAMKEELKSMATNNVWELVELPEGFKQVGCKWVFKTKRDSNGNIERYKARLVAKGYTQKDGIDYKETFSPVSKKDSLRIIMALVAQYNLKLHKIDVKAAFLNGNLEEEVYIDQPEGFSYGV